MREWSETFQKGVLVVCASVLVIMSALAAIGIRPQGAEMVGLTAAVLTLGGLYLLCYRSTREEIALLQNSLEGVKKREGVGLKVVESLARAIDARDQRGRGKAERVRDMAIAIAEEMGISEEAMEELRIAALLSDIGKLAVPDYILFKTEPLTEDELRKVRTHAIVGAGLLSGLDSCAGVAPIVRGHHEWFDGSGYPDRLAGEQIPLGARILAVSDVYNALLSVRPHRQALSSQSALEIIIKGAGMQFDPKVIEACLKVLSQEKGRGFIFDTEDTSTSFVPEAVSENQLAAFADIAQAQQELVDLFEIVQTTATSLNLQEVLELLMSKISKILHAHTGVIFLSERPGDNLRAAVTSGLLTAKLQNRFVRWGEGISGEVAMTGRHSLVNADAGQDLCLLTDMPRSAWAALTHALAVPLLDNQRNVCGTITIYRTAEAPFTNNDLRLLSTVADQASIAIDKARAFEKTAKTARTDHHTGLPNARHCLMQLEQEISRSDRGGGPLSLLLVDVDEFKAVNDNFGHQEGDRILKDIAGILCSSVREYDTVARYGGDEFIVLLPGTANKQALETTLRIKQAVGEYQPNLGEEKSRRIKVSIGVATYPGDADEMSSLIAMADKAMYADKDLSRKHDQLFMEIVGARKEESGRKQTPPAASDA